MHCHQVFVATTLALAFTANAHEENGAVGAAAGRRRRRRGGLAAGFESVSPEPLTFEASEREEEVPRRRRDLQAEVEGEGEGADQEIAFNWMEEHDEDPEGREWEAMDLTIEQGGGYDEDYADFEGFEVYDDMDEDVVIDPADYVMPPQDPQAWDGGDLEYVDEEPEDEEVLPADAQEEGAEVEGEPDEGNEDIGEPMVFNEPISRRLRRVTPKMSNAERSEDDWARYLAEKESMRSEFESVPDFEPLVSDENEEFELQYEPDVDEAIDYDEHDGGRSLQSSCRSNQKRCKIQICTDNSGWETSWKLLRSNGAVVSKGPPGNTKYADNRCYIGAICLNQGTYKLQVNDRFRDGMCGSRTGRGYYNMWLGNQKIASSPSNCGVAWAQRNHQFNVRINNPVPAPAPRPNPQPSPAAVSGRGGCSNVSVQFRTDRYGKETTVTVSGNGRTWMSSAKEVPAYTTKTMQQCLPPGTYTLRLVDQDGLCSVANSAKGWYAMYVNGVKVIAGCRFAGSKTHTIKIGSNWQNSMSNRAREWLNAHNSRRRQHNGGKGYVALRWSNTLANDAKRYAEQLGNNCKNGALVHAKGIQDGENLAKNFGSGSWGNQYSCDQIMRRWVENELNWAYPKNAHYTQVVWRATQYVGCGESVRTYGNQNCRVQVCRYARAGNCNVRNGNWRAEAWKDDTQCGRPCPNEGCFI